MRKRNHKEFIQEMSIINTNIEILGEYLNTNTKILCRCKIDKHEWSASPNDLLRGRGCRICAINKLKKTNSQFLNELQLKFPNIISKNTYTNSNTKMNFHCCDCGYEWKSTSYNLFKGQGCPKCTKIRVAKQISKKHDAFVYELNIINPNIQILSQYSNTHKTVKCKCLVDNYEWDATPSSLLGGSGCPKCNNGIARTHEEFVNIIHDLYGNEFDILGHYTNAHTKILIRHNICNHCYLVEPNKLLYNKKCSFCYCSKGESKCIDILNKYHQDFKPQFIFDDLKGLNNGLLRFDFAIFNQDKEIQYLLEYDGEFHYIDIFENGNFELSQKHDKLKNEYCRLHNLKLIRIPYWDFENIENILIKQLNLKGGEI